MFRAPAIIILVGVAPWTFGMLSDLEVPASEQESVLGPIAHPPHSLTLQDCVEMALANNPGMSEQRWNVEASLADYDTVRGQLWPSVSAEMGYAHYLDDQRLLPPVVPGGLSTYTSDIFSGDIVLRMPLYTSGRLENQIKAAQQVVESVRHRFVRSRRELVYNVYGVFYSILGQKEVINSLGFSQKALREHRERVRELLDVQKAAPVDLLRTEVRLADIEQQLIKERSLLDVQKSLLASLLGTERRAQSFEIEGRLTATDYHVEADESLALALSQRRDYKAAKAKVQSQQKNLEAANAEQWPIVSLEAAYGNRWAAGPTAGGSSTSEDTGRVGVMVAIPLFEGGQIRARIRRERFRLSAEQAALRALELRIRLEVETALSNVVSTRARVHSMGKAVEQAKESLRIEREKYDLGKGAIVDVLDAQAALLEAQTVYYKALADHNIAMAQWRLAVGEEL